jgi:hypothetical protein
LKRRPEYKPETDKKMYNLTQSKNKMHLFCKMADEHVIPEDREERRGLVFNNDLSKVSGLKAGPGVRFSRRGFPIFLVFLPENLVLPSKM